MWVFVLFGCLCGLHRTGKQIRNNLDRYLSGSDTHLRRKHEYSKSNPMKRKDDIHINTPQKCQAKCDSRVTRWLRRPNRVILEPDIAQTSAHTRSMYEIVRRIDQVVDTVDDCCQRGIRHCAITGIARVSKIWPCWVQPYIAWASLGGVGEVGPIVWYGYVVEY